MADLDKNSFKEDAEKAAEQSGTITDNEVFEKMNAMFTKISKPTRLKNIRKIPDTFQEQLDRFNAVWKFSGKRGRLTRMNYEHILFSIWKHHNDWDSENGFEIKCFRHRTMARVRKMAEEAGLLIRTRNYFVGDHTNEYHKNQPLFDFIFRGSDNRYAEWLMESERYNYDIIDVELRKEFEDIKFKKNHFFTMKTEQQERHIKRMENKKQKLNYDIRMLYIICYEMLETYMDHLVTLNRAVPHRDLEFISYLYFDGNGFPKGRPYSRFCSTGNDNKKHRDDSLELRTQFLKRIGLPDYYEVYDIKSEVPRINWLFHTGEWKDDSYDFYTEIINDYETRCPDPDGDRISRGKAGDEYYNDSMKQLFMRIYFGKGTWKQAYDGYKEEKLAREKAKIYWPWAKDEDFIPYDFNDWYELCVATENICGPTIGPLIFWYSFFIETEVKIELLNRGKKVYNVYDGFYFNQDIKDEISDILKIKAKYVYEKYMKPVNKRKLD
jgi:hypothetical protein